ncbi:MULTISPECIES: M24 family metallopeptidase [Bacillaceae]|uniref:M24 family metallopeptidase n=1 Tax=Bacillaceae TaxID=186817 RepID=UPI0009DE4A07|nr:MULTISPECIES: Xaa-Pro peptidase family protein [Bacillaceae]MCF2648689.1 aminopeptidase P family protein [Niallia circulans]
MEQKLESLAHWMKQEEIDFTFLTSTDNIFYFSGFYSDPHERLLALILFPEKDPILVCPSMEKNDAKNAGWNHDIIGYSDTDNPWETIQTMVEARTSSRNKVALEMDHMNVARYHALQTSFPTIQSYVSAEEKINTLRMIKTADELAKIKEACKWADYAIEVGCNEIEEGKSEMEILASIEYELKKKGIGKMSFSTMVLTGINGASPHGNPGETQIKKGDLVLFDLGVVVDGYCSDITRTVAYGDISEKQKDIYDTVLKAQLAAIEVSKAGVSCATIDQVARNTIRNAGYGEFFPHRLGHGLGISVHEFPSLTETNPLLLQEGMVYTIEPGIYVPNVAGVRIEDDVYVTKEGVEILTKFPKELQVIS